jgi:hypothetical protein
VSAAGHSTPALEPREGAWRFELDPYDRCGMPGFRNVAWSVGEVADEASEDDE